jgi:AsmA protein
MSRSVRIQLFVFAVILAILAAPFLIPVNAYRGPLERSASRALSREVHIKGPLHLTVYPDIGLSLSDVSVGNVAGARNPQFLTAEHVIVGAKIAPLFSGHLEVTELTLQKPAIHLETGKNGASNWTFGREPESGRPADAAALNRIGFSHLNIRDGEITYSDAQTGKNTEISDVSLSLDMPDVARATLALPLTLDGALTYHGEKLKISGRLDNFGALLNARNTGGRLSIGSNVINADFTGTLGTEGVSGALKLGAHSVRSFAAWLGSPMPPGNGFGLVALEGQFTGRDGVYSLTHTHVAFDSMNLNGDIAFDTNPDILAVKGHASLDRLDVNPYLAPGASDDTVTAAKAKTAHPDAPLALGGLKALNADMTLVVGGLVLPNAKLDQAIVKVALNKGVLKADLTSITAYGGTGKGNLMVDASGATPVLHGALEMSGIKAQPFLTDALDIRKISGTGTVNFDLSSRGDSATSITKALNGKSEIRIADGAISGVDLAAVARVVQTALAGDVPGDIAGDGAKTPFSRLGASFTIQNGLMRSDDIQLVSPVVQMNGRGVVDLPAHALELHFDPKPVKPIPGLRLADIGVPFFVKGPWEKPHYGPDVRGLAKTIAEKLERNGAAPLDLLTQPGLSLKSILGTDKRTNK